MYIYTYTHEGYIWTCFVCDNCYVSKRQLGMPEAGKWVLETEVADLLSSGGTLRASLKEAGLRHFQRLKFWIHSHVTMSPSEESSLFGVYPCSWPQSSAEGYGTEIARQPTFNPMPTLGDTIWNLKCRSGFESTVKRSTVKYSSRTC